jgi:hypothetical protein
MHEVFNIILYFSIKLITLPSTMERGFSIFSKVLYTCTRLFTVNVLTLIIALFLKYTIVVRGVRTEG